MKKVCLIIFSLNTCFPFVSCGEDEDVDVDGNLNEKSNAEGSVSDIDKTADESRSDNSGSDLSICLEGQVLSAYGWHTGAEKRKVQLLLLVITSLVNAMYLIGQVLCILTKTD